MGFFLLLGLLTVGLVVGSLSGSSDDSSGNPDPEPRDEGEIVEGSDQNDELTGTGFADLVFGQAGDDTITGGNGDDVLLGSGGDDDVRGDAGDDLIAGGGGDDSVNAGRGDDLVLGGVGDDTLHGNDGDDSLGGVSGMDTLFGDAGNDLLSGIEAPDTWAPDADLAAELEAKLIEDHGTDANAAILARAETQFASHGPVPDDGGGDSMEGGAGNDTLIGDSGDTMTGGAGLDSFLIDAARSDQLYTADGYEAVTISDFDVGTATVPGETLQLLSIQASGAPAAVTLAQVGNNVEVRLGEETVAILANRVAANIDASRISVVTRAAVSGGPGVI